MRAVNGPVSGLTAELDLPMLAVEVCSTQERVKIVLNAHNKHDRERSQGKGHTLHRQTGEERSNNSQVSDWGQHLALSSNMI